MKKNEAFKALGFSLWVIGLILTFIRPDVVGLVVWFGGFMVYFWFDIGNQKDQARKVQESQ